MVSRFNGAVSSRQHLCGGGPQGSLLIVLLFCVQVNKAGNPCPRIDANVRLPDGHFGPLPKPNFISDIKMCHNTEKTMKKIYIDDLSILDSINLRNSLLPISPTFIGPMNYHEGCQKYLPLDQSILQHKLEDMQNFTNKNLMLINKKKTMIMPFNFCKTYDFVPALKFPGEEEPLNVIYETKLLGVTIRSDLSFSSHVTNIVKSANSCMCGCY